MKPQAILNLALTLAISGAIALPVKANPVTRTTPVQQGALIPQTAGLIIKLPANITVDVGQKQDYPLTVPLAQPLMDAQGNEVVPINTPVTIKIKPENGGARLVAESIVVKGQIVPVQANTAVIPGATLEQQSGAERARENSAVYGNLFGAVLGATAPKTRKAEQFDQGGMIGGAIGILSGLGSPKNVRIVQLPGDSVYVLSLQSPISLPMIAAIAQSPAQPPVQDTATQPQFEFRNVLDYSKGIENVISSFKNGQLSQSEARRVIVAADQYATTVLTPKLFPPAGIRRQVAQLFDFTYSIDRSK
jgi:hypothetical protein